MKPSVTTHKKGKGMRDKILSLSKFAHWLDGYKSFWHSLRCQKVTIPPNLADTILAQKFNERSEEWWKDIVGQYFTPLRASGILVEADIDRNLLLNATQIAQPDQIQGLYLIVAKECNLVCDYCLYGTKAMNKSGETMMSESVALRAIDCFSQVTRNNHHYDSYWQQITFYGGEPLLNFATIQAATEWTKQLQNRGDIWEHTRIVINSNGVLIDWQTAVWLAHENIEIQISLDGFRSTHDRHRITRLGGGSYHDALRGLKFLCKAGTVVVPMITLNEDNLDSLPDFIYWLCSEFPIQSYGMNILMSTTGDCRVDYPLMAARAMWNANKATQPLGVQDDCFVDTLNAFAGLQITPQRCGAGKKITVFPDGSLHTCQALENSGLTDIGKLPVFK